MKINWNRKYTTVAFYVILVTLLIFTIITLYSNGTFSNLLTSVFNGFQSVASGLVIFYLVKPLFLLFDGKVFGFLGRKKKYLLQRFFSSSVTVILLTGFLLVNIIFTLPNVLQDISELSNNLQDYVINFNKMLESHESQYFPTIFPQIAKVLIDFANNLLKIIENLLPRIEVLFNLLLNISVILVLGMIFSAIYMYRYEDREAEFKYISHVVLKEKNYTRLGNLAKKAADTCIPFYRKNFLNSLGIGILVYLFLLICGIEYAPIIGVAAFVFTLIPVFGHALTYIAASSIIFIIDWKVGIFFSLFLLALLICDYIFIYRKFVGKLGLTSEWILIILLILLGFTSFIGILVGVPVCSVVYTLIKEKIEMKLEKKKAESTTGNETVSQEEISEDTSETNTDNTSEINSDNT